MKRIGTAVTIDPEDFSNDQLVILDTWLAANGCGIVARQPIVIEDDRVTFEELCPRDRLDLVQRDGDDVVTTTRTLPITVPIGPYLEQLSKAGSPFA